MADPRQMLEAKKAKILADAKKAVAEIEQDIDKIDQLKALASKYGLEIVEQNRSAASGITMTADSAMIADATVVKSISRQVVEEAEQFVRAKGRPVRLSAIYDQIENKGIKVGGMRPISTLSAYLSQSERLESIRRGWWWLKGVQIPKHGHKMGDDDEKLPFSA